MARRSSIKGDFKLRGVLRRIGQMGESDLPPALEDAANLVLKTQKELIPKDTGAAAGALQARITKANQQSGLDARVGIIGKRDNRKFYYLRFIEYGTKGYTGDKRSGNRNRRKKNKTDGQSFFGYQPDIPARPARPWLRPSIDLNRDEIADIIRKAIDSTLDKAARSADG